MGGSMGSLYAAPLIDGYINKSVQGGHLYYSHTVFVTKANMSKAVGWDFFNNKSLVSKYMQLPLVKAVSNPPK